MTIPPPPMSAPPNDANIIESICVSVPPASKHETKIDAAVIIKFIGRRSVIHTSSVVLEFIHDPKMYFSVAECIALPQCITDADDTKICFDARANADAL